MKLELKKGDSVAVEGSSKTLPNGLLHLLVEARVQTSIERSAKKDSVALFTTKPDGKKAEKARKLDVLVIADDQAREAIGSPLDGYRKRLEEHVETMYSWYTKHVFELGDPVSGEVLERIEERVGFELPEAARILFSQLNGLQWFWTTGMDIESPDSLDWQQTGDVSSSFWQKLKEAEVDKLNMGLTCIPDVETIFFSKWHLGADPDTATGTVKLGKRKIDARRFYQNLFGFDFFSTSYPCGLWADQDTRDFYVVYGEDAGAGWECEPVPFEGYMEALIARDATDRLMVRGGIKDSYLPYRLLNMVDKWGV